MNSFYAPNFEKVGSILLSVCPSVRPSMCPSVQKKIKARVLKFHIWIPRRKIANLFLAHLSQRLIGELIVYPWSGVRRPSSSTMLKHLLLRNCLADQSQILCGASLGRGNEILFAASGSHDQDGHHAHIW